MHSRGESMVLKIDETDELVSRNSESSSKIWKP
jgi:hypothetical protein